VSENHFLKTEPPPRQGLRGGGSDYPTTECAGAAHEHPSMRPAGPPQGPWGNRGSRPRPTAQRLAVAVSRDRARVETLPRTNPRRTPSLISVAACPDIAECEP